MGDVALVELLDRGVADLVDVSGLPTGVAAHVDHLAGRHERWLPETGCHPALAARALVGAGRIDEATALVGSWRADDVVTWSPHLRCAGLWAASRTGPREVVEVLSAALSAGAGPFLVDGGAPLGPLDTFLGLAAVSVGDDTGGIALLHRGVLAGDARAPVWGAIARLELARALLGTPQPALDEARDARLAASLFFRASGHQHLAGVADRLGGRPVGGPGAAPGMGHLVPGEERWTVGFGVEVAATVTPGKGLRVLRHLLRHPGRTVPAVVLDEIASGSSRPGTSAPAGDVDIDALIGAGEALTDLRARYLDDQIRSRVSKLVRRSITALGQAHGYLGRHLDATVHTGHRCRYEPSHPVCWRT